MENTQIICRGSFIEHDVYVPKDKILFEIFTVKVGKQMLLEWEKSQLEYYISDFDTKEEWEEYLQKNKKELKEYENKLIKSIYIDKEIYVNVTVQHIAYNIFTITTIFKVK